MLRKQHDLAVDQLLRYGNMPDTQAVVPAVIKHRDVICSSIKSQILHVHLMKDLGNIIHARLLIIDPAKDLVVREDPAVHIRQHIRHGEIIDHLSFQSAILTGKPDESLFQRLMIHKIKDNQRQYINHKCCSSHQTCWNINTEQDDRNHQQNGAKNSREYHISPQKRTHLDLVFLVLLLHDGGIILYNNAVVKRPHSVSLLRYATFHLKGKADSRIHDLQFFLHAFQMLLTLRSQLCTFIVKPDRLFQSDIRSGKHLIDLFQPFQAFIHIKTTFFHHISSNLLIDQPPWSDLRYGPPL